MVSPFDLSHSSHWWRLISSMFLTWNFCCKATRANGFYGAWPGWAVSVSVLPLTNTMIRQRRNKGYGYLKTA